MMIFYAFEEGRGCCCINNGFGDEEADSNDLSWSMESSIIIRVQTLDISSTILAAKIPLFYKVAKNLGGTSL